MNAATKEQQPLQQGNGRVYDGDGNEAERALVYEIVHPLLDKLCGSSSYHVMTAYLLVTSITTAKIARL
jgi:hypothetical protein